MSSAPRISMTEFLFKLDPASRNSGGAPSVRCWPRLITLTCRYDFPVSPSHRSAANWSYCGSVRSEICMEERIIPKRAAAANTNGRVRKTFRKKPLVLSPASVVMRSAFAFTFTDYASCCMYSRRTWSPSLIGFSLRIMISLPWIGVGSSADFLPSVANILTVTLLTT